MQNHLKQNIVNIVKQKGLSIRKLERDAGLHKNYISNFLHNKSKNPGIDSIIKIAEVLDVTIDQLIGKESEQKIYNLVIARKELFFEVMDYLLISVRNKKNNDLALERFFHAIHEIYTFSLKKNGFDKEFADWYINCQL